MTPAELRKRTKQFAVDVISFTEKLPRKRAAGIIARQLIRSGTSVGANYRSACRARSKADFAAKIAIVLEEADECAYWIEILVASGIANKTMAASLFTEAGELVAIAAASLKTARNQGDI